MTINSKIETSPLVYARIGGILYFVIIVTGVFAEIFVRNKVIVPGDTAATAHQMLMHELLWRISIIADLMMHICDIPLMLIFYYLLKPVNKNLALLALLFNLVQTAVLVANKLNLLTALFLVESTSNLKAFSLIQLQQMSYLSIRLHEYGFAIGLIFFGCACLVYGYLIIKSGYLPKLLGIFLQIAGLCYLINSSLLILAPAYAHILSPAILLPPFIAELSLCLWLLFKGVDVLKWDQARGGVYS